jgi:hypothetical protein
VCFLLGLDVGMDPYWILCLSYQFGGEIPRRAFGEALGLSELMCRLLH